MDLSLQSPSTGVPFGRITKVCELLQIGRVVSGTARYDMVEEVEIQGLSQPIMSTALKSFVEFSPSTRWTSFISGRVSDAPLFVIRTDFLFEAIPMDVLRINLSVLRKRWIRRRSRALQLRFDVVEVTWDRLLYQAWNVVPTGGFATKFEIAVTKLIPCQCRVHLKCGLYKWFRHHLLLFVFKRSTIIL